MTPTLLDHLFVALVLGIAFPIGGWWAYRRFLARLAREGERALVREYQYTMIWLLGLGLGALALWLAHERDWAAMGLAIGAGPGAVLGIAVGALAGLALRPAAAAVSAKAATALRRQMGSLEAFLPKTRTQLLWGLAVSVFAGVFEEIAYRGYLIAYLGAWLDQWGALAASSVLFGLAHLYQGKAGVLVTTLLGAALGWLYLETGSLLLPIILHAAIDISSMVTAWIVLRPGGGGATASASAPARS